MNDAELDTAIRDALHRVAPEADLDGLGPGAPLRETLDIDSFDFLNVLVALNKRLGVEIPESDYGLLTTFDGLRRYLRARVTPRPS
jgi:acyl carrier protein